MRTRRLSIGRDRHTVVDLLGLTMPFVDPAVLCPPAADHGKKKRVRTKEQRAKEVERLGFVPPLVHLNLNLNQSHSTFNIQPKS